MITLYIIKLKNLKLVIQLLRPIFLYTINIQKRPKAINFAVIKLYFHVSNIIVFYINICTYTLFQELGYIILNYLQCDFPLVVHPYFQSLYVYICILTHCRNLFYMFTNKLKHTILLYFIGFSCLFFFVSHSKFLFYNARITLYIYIKLINGVR